MAFCASRSMAWENVSQYDTHVDLKQSAINSDWYLSYDVDKETGRDEWIGLVKDKDAGCIDYVDNNHRKVMDVKGVRVAFRLSYGTTRCAIVPDSKSGSSYLIKVVKENSFLTLDGHYFYTGGLSKAVEEGRNTKML